MIINFKPIISESNKISPGFYIGRISSMEIVNSPYDLEDQLIITWNIKDYCHNDTVKLWSSNSKKKKYALEKLNNLCDILEIHLPKETDSFFDTDNFIDRVCGILIDNVNGNPFIKEYRKATDVILDEIPF